MATTRHVDLEVEARIEQLEVKGWSPTQIYEQLERDQKFRGRVPTLRTVQRKVATIRDRDKSRAWTLEHAEPDEAAAVLPVLAAVIRETEGRVRSVSTAQASYIVKIRTACPDLNPYVAYVHASLYVNRAARQEPVDDLDAYLAFQPWHSKESLAAYVDAVRHGWISGQVAAYLGLHSLPGILEKAIREVSGDVSEQELERRKEEWTLHDLANAMIEKAEGSDGE